jgi:ribonuclease HI
MSTTHFEIFTDGSCRGNPGPGGWAGLIKNLDNDEEIVVKGNSSETTNNIMELSAIIFSIKKVKEQYLAVSSIKIYSDSNYCIKGISEWMPGWIKTDFKGKKNVDLWKYYLQVSAGLKITTEWVKAHNGHPENERVDKIAFEEASKF